jgi:hypothetical protein
MLYLRRDSSVTQFRCTVCWYPAAGPLPARRARSGAATVKIIDVFTLAALSRLASFKCKSLNKKVKLNQAKV